MKKRIPGSVMAIRVLFFIRKYHVENGYTPTLREIGENFGMTKEGARHYVNKLVASGKILKDKYKLRGIELK